MFFLRKSNTENTIKRSVMCEGRGVHSGVATKVTINPAPLGHGIVFTCWHMKKQIRIPAHVDYVSSTSYHTTLREPLSGATLSTVEHLMAALFLMRVDNALIAVEGPEIPIVDGSSQPWVELLQKTGLKTQRTARTPPPLKPTTPVTVTHEDTWLRVSPSDAFSVTMTVPLGKGKKHVYTYCPAEDSAREIVSARTFAQRKHVEYLKNHGFIKGGSLDNALVLDGDKPLNPGGLRLQDECARHKVLDLLGDWALAGRAIVGHVEGYASGHTLNLQLLQKILMNDKEVSCVENTHASRHMVSLVLPQIPQKALAT